MTDCHITLYQEFPRRISSSGLSGDIFADTPVAHTSSVITVKIAEILNFLFSILFPPILHYNADCVSFGSPSLASLYSSDQSSPL